MKTIKKGELFQNLSGFLTTKGIELKDGVYASRIDKACGLLTDAINGTQKTVSRAKVEVDKKLDQLRQTIHEATAPEKQKTQPKGKTAGRAKAKPSAASGKSAKQK
jgi:hypothetical protein